nr:hypothetical protein [Mycoplasmopsis bovis]
MWWNQRRRKEETWSLTKIQVEIKTLEENKTPVKVQIKAKIQVEIKTLKNRQKTSGGWKKTPEGNKTPEENKTPERK